MIDISPLALEIRVTFELDLDVIRFMTSNHLTLDIRIDSSLSLICKNLI